MTGASSRRTLAAFAALAALCAAPLAGAQNAPPGGAAWPSTAANGVDTTGKGAVMCLWVIYLAVQDVGRGCYPGRDAEFQAELATTVSAVERFILANGTPRPTQPQLDVIKARYVEQGRAHNLCRSGGVQMYETIRRSGTDVLHKATQDLLSVPREPVLDPCLGL